ncbi:MAG: type II toxin-antitoxin system RelE/ParE family toxin [Porticoccaceae bacterium]
MTPPVYIRAEAEQDLDEAAGWYEKQQPGLGQQFLDEVLIALRSICERPNMYPSVGRGARRTLIRRFPFGIYYRTEKDGIVVVAVMHGSRSPRRWQRRT